MSPDGEFDKLPPSLRGKFNIIAFSIDGTRPFVTDIDHVFFFPPSWNGRSSRLYYCNCDVAFKQRDPAVPPLRVVSALLRLMLI
jgi:hypothetical protein